MLMDMTDYVIMTLIRSVAVILKYLLAVAGTQWDASLRTDMSASTALKNV